MSWLYFSAVRVRSTAFLDNGPDVSQTAYVVVLIHGCPATGPGTPALRSVTLVMLLVPPEQLPAEPVRPYVPHDKSQVERFFSELNAQMPGLGLPLAPRPGARPRRRRPTGGALS